MSFDLDGTLLDRDKSLVAFLEAQYIRIPALQAVNKQHFLHRFIELDQKGYVWKDKVYQQLCEEFALDISWEYLLDDYMESFQPNETIYVGDHPTNDVDASINAGMIGV